HLDADRSVAWRRRLDALDGSHPAALDSPPGGGYLVAGIDEATGLVRLASLAPDRPLRWAGQHGATAEGVDPNYRVADLLAAGPDDALLV
ncbi:MAG: hypothetical protein GWN07_35550, partial [Actinobacteria bacterium]|nr:hypothetical protein [Actinomycetota bacterium]NIU70729.1 hypothetical protein [Actinomycetota bacterium]NIV90319.1 hypothetical protein [Actinomycetota bacterium]NIW32631.1 hypothetical protein [Actinomycetota bacterium]NIX24835.1 hypothetical protein [Actinomycetota bacterium]